MAEVELAGGTRELATVARRARAIRPRTSPTTRSMRSRIFSRRSVPVGEHLADQLLLPLAVAGGGRFRCDELSLHATTNIETIGAFLDIPIKTEKHGGGVDVVVG